MIASACADLVTGRATAERQTQRARRRSLVNADRQEHVARLDAAGRAGRPGRRLDPLQVARRDEVAALDPVDDDAGAVREASRRMPRPPDPVDRRQSCQELVAERRLPEALARLRPGVGSQREGGRESDGAGDVLRPCATLALLGAALQQRDERRPLRT